MGPAIPVDHGQAVERRYPHRTVAVDQRATNVLRRHARVAPQAAVAVEAVKPRVGGEGQFAATAVDTVHAWRGAIGERDRLRLPGGVDHVDPALPGHPDTTIDGGVQG